MNDAHLSKNIQNPTTDEVQTFALTVKTSKQANWAN